MILCCIDLVLRAYALTTGVIVHVNNAANHITAVISTIQTLVYHWSHVLYSAVHVSGPLVVLTVPGDHSLPVDYPVHTLTPPLLICYINMDC